jgi:hypothetical protein
VANLKIFQAMSIPRIALFAEQGHFTAVHNLTFRVVMPQISSSAWKVLCFLISETVGYNRRSEFISYNDIKAGTGLRSSATIAKALGELLEGAPFGSPLIVRQVGAKCGAASHEAARYGLNLKCTVALQKSHQKSKCPGSSKNEARRIRTSSKSEAPQGAFFELPDAPENEAPIFAPHGNARAPTETSDEKSDSLRASMSGDMAPPDFELPSDAFTSPHFRAVCSACELDIELLSGRRKMNAAQRAAQLATKYSPEQIRLAGARWSLPTAPHPDQLLDSMRALLQRRERAGPGSQSPLDRPAPRNEAQRNASERRALMAELAERYR